MRTLLTLAVLLASFDAAAAIPAWCKSTDCRHLNKPGPQTGTQGCGSDVARLLERGARNRLASNGPSMPTLGQGCADTKSVTASAPCPLVKAIAYAESVWTQFCTDGCGTSGQTLISFDCGYGIMQVTSGMTGGAGFDPMRVAAEPRYNVGAGMKILFDKWRSTPCVGDNQPTTLEHWYFATWAYNGYGWVNNPNNPRLAPWPRPAYNGPGTLARGSYPYQEVIWGLLRHPPGERWAPIAASYPDLGEICNVDGCRHSGANSEPQPVHTDTCQTAAPTDDAALVSEAPANPVVAYAGDAVKKGWKLRNVGDTVWSTAEGYALVRISGDLPGAPERVELASGKAFAGEDLVELEVTVTAGAPGPKRAVYRMHHGTEAFGPELELALNVSTTEDVDGDGHARPAFGGDDCDDTDPATHPGAAEQCDGKDNDCDGQVDKGLVRACTTACGAGQETCSGGVYGACTAPPVIAETCNGVDDDCDGDIDNGDICPPGSWCLFGACRDFDGKAPPETGCGCGAGGGGASGLLGLVALVLCRRRTVR